MPIYLHSGYDISSVADPRERYSVAGREAIVLRVTGLYDSQYAIVRFTRFNATSSTALTGEVDLGAGVVRATSPALMVPHDWFAGCADVSRPARNTAGTCVPDLPVSISLSLDGGTTFAPTTPSITYGYRPKLKVAFMYVGPVRDYGWTMAHNQGRLELEREFGGLVNVSTYVESVDDGEFAFEQPNLGSTIATNTPVPEFFGNGTKNLYHMGLEQLKRWCDEDFDLVFSTSFGFMSQTIDVSSGYAPCRHAASNTNTPHFTHFVHATGHRTNNLTSTMYGKVYQVKYLAGLVAGDALAAPRGSLMAMPRGGTCVAYVAPFPIAEVQRHINAFAIGCRERFPQCVVKTMFMGHWHNKTLEGLACVITNRPQPTLASGCSSRLVFVPRSCRAHLFYNEEGCDIITQGTDDLESQLVYAAYGAHGIGYNYDMRQIVGESVLTAPMLAWGNIYSPFVAEKLAGTWTSEQNVWRGVAEGAVSLAPTFSPRVEDATILVVEQAMKRLRAAPGDEAFKHIFCGPIAKRWVYDYEDSGTGPRARGCGAGNPVWRRLDAPEQINLRHYRDADGQPLPAGRTTPLATDCLWGMDRAGQALLDDAYPFPFDEDHVFNDYLIEGVELLDARTTIYGTVHSETSHGCGDFAAGDRFFSERPVAVPPSPPPPASPPFEAPFPVIAVAVPISGVVFVALIIVLLCARQRERAKKTIGLLKQELETFKDSIVGVRVVVEAYDPREDAGFTLPRASAISSAQKAEKLRVELRLGDIYQFASPETIAPLACRRLDVEIREGATTGELLNAAYIRIFGEDMRTVDPPPPHASIARARWWWGEDAGSIERHDVESVKQPGNWVSYNTSVCVELDRYYHEYVKGAGPAEVEVDLADRIGSTGTEQKAINQSTGVVFKIDLANMKQINKQSGFARKVLREEKVVEVVAPAIRIGAEARAAKSSTAAASKPLEIAEESSLILYPGQLLQTSKQRPDGWAFGSVVLDVMTDRPPIGVDGMSTQAGWFPLDKTALPSQEQLSTLQKKMGGGEGANEALKPPQAWQQVRDPLEPERFTLSEGEEKAKVIEAFMATLLPTIQVESVQRVQNMSMWQSYAVKRQTVLQREKDGAANQGAKKTSRYERVWLFHGTDEHTVPKIIEMGFNRSFCGKNATAFGKGVYFARDAAYSSSAQYSRPDAQGVQHMFLVRVVIGEYCAGKRDQLTPDVRQGHQLYDTTVNKIQDPSIYVTYHDAQAYPEYLVSFKQA